MWNVVEKTEKQTEKQADLACFCYKNPSMERRVL